MARYLNNASGADSRVNIPSVVIGATVGDYIEFKCVANAGNVSNIYVLAGLVSGTTNSVRVEPTRIILTAANGSTTFTTGYVQPAVGDIFTVRLTKSSATTWDATLNGSLLSTNTFSSNLTLTAFGSRNSSLTDAFRGGYYHVAISTNGGASATRYYDPSASGGTGAILPDTVNSANNGTQYGNWPPDNSEWVFYSSGGSAQTITVPADQFLTQASAISILVSQAVSSSGASQNTQSSEVAVTLAQALTAGSAQDLQQASAALVSQAQVITAANGQQIVQAVQVEITQSGANAQDIAVPISQYLTQAVVSAVTQVQSAIARTGEHLVQAQFGSVTQSFSVSVSDGQQIEQSATASLTMEQRIIVAICQQLTQAVTAGDLPPIINAYRLEVTLLRSPFTMAKTTPVFTFEKTTPKFELYR